MSGIARFSGLRIAAGCAAGLIAVLGLVPGCGESTPPQREPAKAKPVGAPISAPTPSPVAAEPAPPPVAAAPQAPVEAKAQPGKPASVEPTAVPQKPSVASAASTGKPIGSPDADRPDYLNVSFNELASFDYDPFEAVEELNLSGKLDPTAPADGPKPTSRLIPAPVKALSGKRITVQGFMVPLEVRKNDVRSFLLVRNQMVCCFGAAASFNEWVYVQMEPEKSVRFTPDVLIGVYGTFDVGEDVQDGIVMSLYRLTGRDVVIRGGV